MWKLREKRKKRMRKILLRDALRSLLPYEEDHWGDLKTLKISPLFKKSKQIQVVLLSSDRIR